MDESIKAVPVLRVGKTVASAVSAFFRHVIKERISSDRAKRSRNAICTVHENIPKRAPSLCRGVLKSLVVPEEILGSIPRVCVAVSRRGKADRQPLRQ